MLKSLIFPISIFITKPKSRLKHKFEFRIINIGHIKDFFNISNSHARKNLFYFEKMAQKSITSFFSKAPAKPLSADTKDNIKKEIIAQQDDSCSPVKNGSKGSKRLRIESDSESNSPPGKRNSNQSSLKSPKKEFISNETKETINRKSPKNNTPKVTKGSKKSPKTSQKSAEKKKVAKSTPKVTKKTTPVSKKQEKNDDNKSVTSDEKICKDDNDLKEKVLSLDCSDNDEEKEDVKVKKGASKKDLTSSDEESNNKDTKKKSVGKIVPKKGGKKQAISSDDNNSTDDESKKQHADKSEDDIVVKKNVKKRAISSSDDGESDEDTAKKSPPKKPVKKADKKSYPKEKNENSPPAKKPQGFQNFFTSTKNIDSANDSKKSTSDGANYNPSKTKYHPIDDASWSRGEKVPYLALAKTLEEIEKTSARLKIVEVLSNFFRSVMLLTPEDLLPSVYLCLNKLAPAYESVELGIAEFTLMKAIAQSTGRSLAQIKSDCNSTGDLGLVAEQSRTNQRMMFQPAALNVRVVFEKLRDIAKMTGHSSMSKKVDKIQSMFVACRHSESRYLVRSLAGKLRIGLAEQSVLQALAQACTTTPPLATQGEKWPPEIINSSKGLSAEQFKAAIEEKALILKTTYCECPNYDKIIPVMLENGIAELPKHCKLTPGIPLKPMLAHPTKGVHEVLQRFENVEFTCEWKYDGERAQIHVPSSSNDDGVLSADIANASIYSRNQENNTSKYPDILGRLSNTLKPSVQSCVLDCEAVAWDKEKKQILPFQVLSTRKRKDANEADIKVAVCIFMFDLLYLNGEPLVKKPFEERRRLLREHFNLIEGEWHMATSLDCSTTESIQEFLEESIRGNCEGLMVKTLNGKEATYEIAKRSRNWLKLKKDYLDGIGDTIDAVVLGGYLGRGKRAGVYGGFLLACHDRQSDEYQTLCKIGTGFSDEDLQTHSKTLKEHIIDGPKNYYRYDSTLEPDHWFAPAQVWEIKCADLSLSPVHMAALGIVHPEKGISLRFPRFIRVREDKTSEEATSAQQVADMYSNQDQVKNQTGSSKNVEEDFY